jgi:cytochrome c-type biogenesis protein CcmE
VFGRSNLMIGFALLVLGAAIFAWSATRPPPLYYKFVDELVADAQKFGAKRARLDVHGCVARDSLFKARDRPLYRFRIESIPERPAAAIEATYVGVLPDLFRPGIRIVANGRLDDDGRLQVVQDGLMVACPGKYDGPGPHVIDCPPRDGGA